MKIDRLDLLAYGPFRDRSVELGPGLHLLYGPNEAGKSTTLRALSSLFFGYPDRRQDDWLVGTADMALGARISRRDGRSMEFVRRRRGRLPLATPDGTVLSEDALSAFLGGISKMAFEHLFSLDHERLRLHGQELLDEGGALGAGLVEAGSGIQDLRRKLDQITRSRKELFLPTGKNPPINRILQRLLEIRRDLKGRVVSPQEYKREEEEIQRLTREEQSIEGRRKEIESQIRRFERILRILPRRQELEALVPKLAAIDDVPLLREEFYTLRIQSQTESEQAGAELQKIDQEAKALEDEIRKLEEAGIPVDLPDEELKTLEDGIGAIAKSLSDLPRRQHELSAMEREAGNLLRQSGLPADPLRIKEVLVSPAKRRRMGTLLQNRATLDGARAEADRILEQSEAARIRAEQEKAAVLPVPDTGRIEELLPVLERHVSREKERRKQQNEVDRRRRNLLESLRALGTGETDLSGLRSMVLPEEKTIQSCRESFRDLLEQEKKSRENLDRLAREKSEQAIRMEQLASSGEIATEQDLVSLRHRRDEAWSLLRRHILEGDAGAGDSFRLFFGKEVLPQDTFEHLLREADKTADLLRARSKEAVELALLRRNVDRTQKEIAKEEERLRLLQTDLESRTDRWISLWPQGLIRKEPSGRPDRFPDAMIEWMEKRRRVLSDGDDLESFESSLKMESQEEDRTVSSVAVLLAGEDPRARETLEMADRTTLLSKAKTVVNEAEDLRRTQERIQDRLSLAIQKRDEAREALRRIESDLVTWSADYRKAGQDWKASLPDDPEDARELLEAFAHLEELSRTMDDLRGRIEAMQEDHRQFEEKISRLSREVPSDPDAEGILEKARSIVRSVRKGRESRIRRGELDKRRKDNQNRKKRQEEILEKNLRILEHLLAEANARDLSELSRIENLSREKSALLSRREELVRQIREDGEGETLEALFEACREQSPDDLNVRLGAMKEEMEEARKSRDALLGTLATRKADLSRKLEETQAVDLTQEAEVERARLSGLVERYVNGTVMEVILRRGMELYRDRNQGPVLARARTLLETLTGGKYRDLRADVGEKGEVVLLVVRDDGRSLEIDALSDGTLDALYLALRLAAILRHNETTEPIPFVADDLLLNLDNQRAGQAFVALTEVARSNQVLFFTHHAHMTDMAREHVPAEVLACHAL